jgi:hypothetical protein
MIGCSVAALEGFTAQCLQKPDSGSDGAEPFEINHSAAPKKQCALSLVGKNEMAVSHCEIHHIDHLNDMKQCSSIWLVHVHSARRSQILA